MRQRGEEQNWKYSIDCVILKKLHCHIKKAGLAQHWTFGVGEEE